MTDETLAEKIARIGATMQLVVVRHDPRIAAYIDARDKAVALSGLTVEQVENHARASTWSPVGFMENFVELLELELTMDQIIAANFPRADIVRSIMAVCS